MNRVASSVTICCAQARARDVAWGKGKTRLHYWHGKSPMDDLEQLIKLGKETKNLDYKGPCGWDEGNKQACCEIVKDILALANSGGGHIVVGVKEEPIGFSLVGLTAEMVATFETTRLNNFLQNYADPPINCTVVKKTVDQKLFVVIEVPSFRETPHICQKDFPRGLQAPTVYVRTDNNESAPIRSSADCRAVIERAVRGQGDRLLESMRAILTGPDQRPATRDSENLYLEELIKVRPRAELATRYNDANGAPKSWISRDSDQAALM
jgi:vacuolar-type H+-ATPase subunit F/Vma7